MQKYKHFAAFMVTLLLFPLFAATAYANSSWVWISETRPVDVLPYVVIATLGIETAVICLYAKTGKTLKVFAVVCIGNLLSFLVPYLLGSVEGMRMGYTIHEALYKTVNHWPSWIVGAGYLGITLIVELPIDYCALEKDAKNPKRLLHAAIAANLLTTVMTAAAERLLCQGRW